MAADREHDRQTVSTTNTVIAAAGEAWGRPAARTRCRWHVCVWVLCLGPVFGSYVWVPGLGPKTTETQASHQHSGLRPRIKHKRRLRYTCGDTLS